MDSTAYTTLARQSGLLKELESVANNIANVSTSGFRAEGVIFTEYVRALDESGGSLSMAYAGARTTDTRQGPLTQTNGAFDLAIEGPGFFQVATPDGLRLTRAGAFVRNADGELAMPDGARLLDEGGSPVFVPPDAKSVTVATDGTLSADSLPLTRIGVVLPADAVALTREDGVRFKPGGALIPVDDAVVQQGFLEDSNVDAIGQMARMIEVQRSYELGQKFLDREDERIRSVVRTLGG